MANTSLSLDPRQTRRGDGIDLTRNAHVRGRHGLLPTGLWRAGGSPRLTGDSSENPGSPEELPVPKGPGKEWTAEQLVPLVEAAPTSGSATCVPSLKFSPTKCHGTSVTEH